MARWEIRSEIAGRVWRLAATVGDRLAAGDPVLILESMKMEIPVAAPGGGTVVEIRVAVEDAVEEGDLVAVMERDG